jgi:hypothetical protein
LHDAFVPATVNKEKTVEAAAVCLRNVRRVD